MSRLKLTQFYERWLFLSLPTFLALVYKSCASLIWPWACMPHILDVSLFFLKIKSWIQLKSSHNQIKTIPARNSNHQWLTQNAYKWLLVSGGLVWLITWRLMLKHSKLFFNNWYDPLIMMMLTMVMVAAVVVVVSNLSDGMCTKTWWNYYLKPCNFNFYM